MPSDAAPKPPRKELKDVPAECDALHKDLGDGSITALATRFIGILRLTASRVAERFTDHGKRLDSLEAFRDEAMKAYLEAKAQADAANKAAEVTPPAKPKSKAKKAGLKVVPPEAPTPAPTEEVKA